MLGSSLLCVIFIGSFYFMARYRRLMNISFLSGPTQASGGFVLEGVCRFRRQLSGEGAQGACGARYLDGERVCAKERCFPARVCQVGL